MTRERMVIGGLIAALGTGCKDRPEACDSNTFALTTVRSATSYSSCATASINPVTQEEARALGFPVDDDLARLAQPIDVPFHHGNFTCGTAADTTGQLRITVAVDRIHHHDNVPAFDVVDPADCPDWLEYDATIDLQTDEGTLSGSVPGEIFAGPDSSGAHAMGVSVIARAAHFSGSLGIRADRAREPLGVVILNLAIRESGVAGEVFTRVAYCDGETPEGDEGDGIFFPPENSEYKCNAVGWGNPWGPLITLDEFNGR